MTSPSCHVCVDQFETAEATRDHTWNTHNVNHERSHYREVRRYRPGQNRPIEARL